MTTKNEMKEQLYNSFHHASVGIIVCNKDGIVYSNSFINHLLNYELTDKLTWEVITTPDENAIIRYKIDRVFDHMEVTVRDKHRLIKKDGSLVNVDFITTPYYIDDHLYVLIHILRRNNEEKLEKELVEIKNQNTLLKKNISDIISVHELDGTILSLTPSFEEITGYNVKAFLGISPTFIVHPDDRKRLKFSFSKLIQTRESHSVRYRIRTKENIFKWVETKQTYYKDSDLDKVVACTSDIEEQVHFEKMLFQSEKLATLGELSVGIVHEIKNPLTSIKGFFQLMKAGTIKKQEYLSILESEINRIEQIASNVLTYAKPRENMKEQNIIDVLNDVYLLMKIQANRKGISLHYSPIDNEIYVIGDETQLKQVFINLVKNAIEASTKGQSIEMKVIQENNSVNIYIMDQGIGIPSEKLSNIGKSFFTTKEEGTGIGLIVTQRIIEKHSGEILVESKVGKGTTFTIKLPL